MDHISILRLSLDLANPFSDIRTLLSNYSNHEKLDDYVCGRDETVGCNQSGNCYKFLEFMEAPENLLIQLKIYDSDHHKINYIPISLDRQIDIKGENLCLCRFIYCTGNSLNAGHYLAELLINSIWYEANDTTIKQISYLTGYTSSKTPIHIAL